MLPINYIYDNYLNYLPEFARLDCLSEDCRELDRGEGGSPWNCAERGEPPSPPSPSPGKKSSISP